MRSDFSSNNIAPFVYTALFFCIPLAVDFNVLSILIALGGYGYTKTSYATLYKQVHRPMSKRLIKPPYSISRVTSIDSDCCRLPVAGRPGGSVGNLETF